MSEARWPPTASPHMDSGDLGPDGAGGATESVPVFLGWPGGEKHFRRPRHQKLRVPGRSPRRQPLPRAPHARPVCSDACQSCSVSF